MKFWRHVYGRGLPIPRQRPQSAVRRCPRESLCLLDVGRSFGRARCPSWGHRGLPEDKEAQGTPDPSLLRSSPVTGEILLLPPQSNLESISISPRNSTQTADRGENSPLPASFLPPSDHLKAKEGENTMDDVHVGHAASEGGATATSCR